MYCALRLVLIFSLLVGGPVVADGNPPATTTWSIWGGEARIRLEAPLLATLGIDSASTVDGLPNQSDPRLGLAITEAAALEFSAIGDSVQAFAAGRLQLQGELLLRHGEQSLRLTGGRIVPGEQPLALALVDGNGEPWFLLDHMHYQPVASSGELRLWNIDLRVSSALAQRLGQPLASGMYLGQIELRTRFKQAVAPLNDPPYCQPIRWPGDQIIPGDPNSGHYKADVLLADDPNNLSVAVLRCQTANQTCDGPGGDDARMVIAPNAELKNSNDADTAAVPWFRKFSGNFPPYGNDQHPFLVWNIYRIEGGGERILQIGRSAVKHAFLTANSGCNGGCPNTHPQNNFQILWPSCQDTYGTGDNNNSTHLGPRSEIIPKTAQWGRCGSIYDADCNSFNDFPTVGDFDYRTELRESTIDPVLHAGASFHIEGWYLIRDDINIFNTMGNRRFFPVYANGWFLSTSGQNFARGPMIDLWVSPEVVGQLQRNRLLDSAEGHFKLAVKVSELGNGQYRYEYALANFDLARAVTTGFEPNLRVISNRGVVALRLPMPAAATLSQTRFHDGDQDPDNSWSFSRVGDELRITGSTTSSLNWGTLFNVGFQTDRAPIGGLATLPMADPGTPTSYTLSTLVPARDPDGLLVDGMEEEG